MTTEKSMRAFYNAIFDVLVREVGASEGERAEYVREGVHRWERGLAPCNGYEFGRYETLRYDSSRLASAAPRGKPVKAPFHVTCHSADLTPDRERMIVKANDALVAVYASLERGDL